MFRGSNCDRKSQLSGILTEPLNPRALRILLFRYFFWMLKVVPGVSLMNEMNSSCPSLDRLNNSLLSVYVPVLFVFFLCMPARVYPYKIWKIIEAYLNLNLNLSLSLVYCPYINLFDSKNVISRFISAWFYWTGGGIDYYFLLF